MLGLPETSPGIENGGEDTVQDHQPELGLKVHIPLQLVVRLLG